MKSSTIILLSSFIIVCNADFNYMDVAEKVLSKLLKIKDPLNGTFNINFSTPYATYVINETKWFDWNRLKLKASSVHGSQSTRDTHYLEFEIYMPSPMIKGKLYYPYSYKKWYESEITAIPSSGISIQANSRINAYYSEAVWTSVSLKWANNYDTGFRSQFDCKMESMSDCDKLNKWIDDGEGPWNELTKLEDQVKRLVYSIKYF